jgi:hypothetical protein
MAAKKKVTEKKLSKAEQDKRRKRRSVGRAKTVTVQGYSTRDYKRAAPRPK